VCTLYVLANVGYLNALPIEGIAQAPQDRVATAAVEAIAPGGGALLMAAIILVSTFGCLNGLILAGARVLYAMSRDGLFPGALARLSGRTEIPVTALWVQAVWAGVLALTGKYGDLLDFVMIAVLGFYVLTIWGRFKLARTLPELAARGWADRWVPSFYVLLVLYVCVGEIYLKPAYPAWSLVIVLTGVPAFFVFRRHRPRLASEGAADD
jgi:APA family basic amino acid/polyamine antiporter